MAIACFVLFFLDRRNHMEDHAGQNYQHTKNSGAKNWNEDIFEFRVKKLSQQCWSSKRCQFTEGLQKKVVDTIGAITNYINFN